MALILNEEQQLLSDSAKEFFTKKMPVSQLRELRDSEAEKGYSEPLWQEMIALGWGGIAISEECGGLGFGYQGLGVVLEESGRTLARVAAIFNLRVRRQCNCLGGQRTAKNRVATAYRNGGFIASISPGGKCHSRP